MDITNKINKSIDNKIGEYIECRANKYGRNVPYKAWLPENVMLSANNEWDSYLPQYVCEGQPKIIYSGRFVAVSGFIFAIVNGKYSILANKRGSGTPDYQGCWNAPCGYLEKFENSIQGIQRETLEECKFFVDEDDFKIVSVETEPEECNNGNVTIRHRAFLGNIIPRYEQENSINGEDNEVDDVKWIPIDDVDKYDWAFNHRKVIDMYAPGKIYRRLIELFYKIFPNNEKY